MPEDTEKRERRYPFPGFEPDRSGEVAALTLKYFVTHPTSHTATELTKDPILGNMLARDRGDRALRVRLLRYSRQGLLLRKRERREYHYEITKFGENRLIHLWERAGLLDPAKADSEVAREEMKVRLELVRSILKAQEKQLTEEIERRRMRKSIQ
jgi:hypothetical protein